MNGLTTKGLIAKATFDVNGDELNAPWSRLTWAGRAVAEVIKATVG